MISFHLPIVPPKATSQGAGKRIVIYGGKPMFFKNAKAASAEHDLLLLCAAHKPSVPIEGPIALTVDFVWPWRASEPKKTVALGRVPHTKKPDCSNVIKLLEDCMTKLGFWKDDGQIADLRITKAWGTAVGITITVSPINSASFYFLAPEPETPEAKVVHPVNPVNRSKTAPARPATPSKTYQPSFF